MKSFSSLFFILFFVSKASLSQFASKEITSDISGQYVEIDLNNDSYLDLIVIGHNKIVNDLPRLYYFENTVGQFLDPVPLVEVEINSIYTSIEKADFNNDGFLDIVMSHRELNKIVWYQNYGNGTFSNAINISTQFQEPTHIAIQDLNNDGFVDLIASSFGGQKIAWFKNLGLNGFGQEDIILSTTTAAQMPIIAEDINQDGNADLIHIDATQETVSVSLNSGGGVFSSAAIVDTYWDLPFYTGAMHVNLFDIDNDGIKDVVTSVRANTDHVYWYKNLGNGFGSRNEITDFFSGLTNINSTQFSDIDLDGDKDLIVNDDLHIYYFKSFNGIFSNNATEIIIPDCMSSGYYASKLSLEDFDNDGYPDLVVNAKGLHLVKNDSLTFTQEQILSPEIKQPSNVCTFDIDNDGLNDLIYSSQYSDAIHYSKNIGNGDFDSVELIIPFGYTTANGPAIFNADIDGDGDQEVITLEVSASSFSHDIKYYNNTGGGNFSAPINIAAQNQDISDIVIGDIDNDGDPDILYCSGQNDAVGYFENLGNGTFSSSQTITSTLMNPKKVAFLDFDNDFDLDIVCVSYDDDKLSLIENLGGNLFGAPQLVITWAPTNRTQVLSKDMDNDGNIDLLLSDYSGDEISWIKNQGGGIFSGLLSISTDMFGPVIESIDYDGDGDLDIISRSSWQFYGIRGVFLLENFGNGNFAPNGPEILPFQSSSFALDDWDTDGDMDFASTDGGRVYLTTNNSNFKATARGRIFFDLNQDGDLDSLEPGLPIQTIETSPNVNYIFSDSIGNYSVNFTDTAISHAIFSNASTNWGLTTDSISYNISVDSLYTVRDSLHFGFFPTDFIDSVNAEIIGGFPVCNDTINYWLNVQNLGTTTPSGVISVDLHDSLSFISSIPPPDSIIGNLFYWNYQNLDYFDDLLINVLVQMPDFMSVGENLVSTITANTLDSVGTELFTTSDSLNQILVCAYDPNDKIASPTGIGYPGFVDPTLETIEYTVRFQNTGTNVATEVVIKDQLDSSLDWSSFTPICGSHNYTSSIDPNGLVTFTFPNINLPDSSVSMLESQGFIRYSINTNMGLPIGTVIENKADIYFDLNPPVLTNWKLHTLYDCSSLFDGSPAPQSTICLNESVSFGSQLPESFYTWEDLNLGVSDSGNYVQLLVDTTAVYTLSVNATNEFCAVDSIISFNVPQITTTPLPEVSICIGDSVEIFGEYYNSSGVHSDTVQSTTGCDSILTISLQVNPIEFTSLGQTSICEGDSALIFNTYEYVSGIYVDTLYSTNGCDSIVSEELVVQQLPIVSFGTVIDDTICINSGTTQLVNGSPLGGTYSGNGVISGAYFDPTISGIGDQVLFYYYTDQNGCSSIDSLAFVVNGCAGISESFLNDVRLYPNPTDGMVQIEFSQPISGTLRIFDVKSRPTQSLTIDNTEKVLLEVFGEVGVYYGEIEIEGVVTNIFKLVKF